MIEVRTSVTARLLKGFNKSQTAKRAWVPIAGWGIMTVLGLVCLLVKSLGILPAIILFAVGALLPLLYIAFSHFLLERMLKDSPVVNNETVQIFRFGEEFIMLNESSKYVTAQDTKIGYDSLVKAYETEEAFVINVSGLHSYILDAKGFTIGARRDLHDLLQARLGKSFSYSKKIYTKK